MSFFFKKKSKSEQNNAAAKPWYREWSEALIVAIILAMIIGPGAGFDMEGIDTSGVSAAEAPPWYCRNALRTAASPPARARGGSRRAR